MDELISFILFYLISSISFLVKTISQVEQKRSIFYWKVIATNHN